MSPEYIEGARAFERILHEMIERGDKPDDIYNYICRRDFRYDDAFIEHYGVQLDCGHYVSPSAARVAYHQSIDVCWCAFVDEDDNPLEVDA